MSDMEYQVVIKYQLGELEEGVNKAISEGWKPIAGFTALHSYWECPREGTQDLQTYYQPMIRKPQRIAGCPGTGPK